MRVISIHAAQTFKPIEFTIIIETQEEIENLEYLALANISVPDAVEKFEPKANVIILKDLLKQIKNEIEEYGYTTPNN